MINMYLYILTEEKHKEIKNCLSNRCVFEVFCFSGYAEIELTIIAIIRTTIPTHKETIIKVLAQFAFVFASSTFPCAAAVLACELKKNPKYFDFHLKFTKLLFIKVLMEKKKLKAYVYAFTSDCFYSLIAIYLKDRYM